MRFLGKRKNLERTKGRNDAKTSFYINSSYHSKFKHLISRFLVQICSSMNILLYGLIRLKTHFCFPPFEDLKMTNNCGVQLDQLLHIGGASPSPVYPVEPNRVVTCGPITSGPARPHHPRKPLPSHAAARRQRASDR